MSLCSFQEDVKPTGTSCHVYLNVPKLKTTNYRPTIKALTPLYIIEYIKFGISFVVGKTTRNTQTATSFTRTGRCGKQTVAVIYFPGCQTSAWRRNRGARGALICKRKYPILCDQVNVKWFSFTLSISVFYLYSKYYNVRLLAFVVI